MENNCRCVARLVREGARHPIPKAALITHPAWTRALTTKEKLGKNADLRPSERRPFILPLPEAPFSFRGTLISVNWELELVALPVEEKSTVPITIAPGRVALVLEATVLKAPLAP